MAAAFKKIFFVAGAMLLVLTLHQTLLSTKVISYWSETRALMTQTCNCDKQHLLVAPGCHDDLLALGDRDDLVVVVSREDDQTVNVLRDQAANNNMSLLHGPPNTTDSGELAPPKPWQVGLANGEDTNLHGEAVPMAEFKPQRAATNQTSTSGQQTELVLFLAYQRTGSSYLGDVLFNYNPGVFYLFEPLDLLYSTMYGVAPGWTVPGDITTHHNGTLRDLPGEELQAVSWMLHQFYSCSMTSFPLGVYTHIFWKSFVRRMQTVSSYVNCLRVENIVGKISGTCRPFIKAVCGSRFEERGRRQDLCKRHLWDHQEVTLPNQPLQAALARRTHSLVPSFKAYDQCVRKFQASITTCIPRLTKPCQDRKLRAIKTVRATMDSAEMLLRTHPNLKVVHLIRDARAVALSRKKAAWSQSIYARGKGFQALGHAYCQTVLRDHTRRLALEKLYPGRTMLLMYDEFLVNPEENFKKVYDFLNWKYPDNLTKLLHLDSFNMTDIEAKRQKWKKEMSPSERVDIYKSCEKLAKKKKVPTATLR